MEMPKPTAEHRRLETLAGTWVGDETVHPTPFDPEGGSAVGTIRSRIALGGFHLISDYRQERDGQGTFEGHGVYGWDPRGMCYTMHWFDSIGMEQGTTAIGSWEGDTLTIEHETSHTGFSRYVWRVGDGEYNLKIQISQDGDSWTTFLEGDYRRVSD